MLRLQLNCIEIATKSMAKIALLLSVCYPFITIPYHTPKSCKKLCRKYKSQVAYDDLKLYRNKVFWIKKMKSLLHQIGLGNLWIKAHYMDVGIFNITRQRLEDNLIKNVFKFKYTM